MNAGLTPLWISIRTSLVATFITFFIGIGSAYLVANYQGKWKGLIDSLFTLPLVLPPTVLGFFLLLLFGKNGPMGKLLLLMDKSIIFTWSATVIAATVVAFPMMYRSARSAFEQIDVNLISAAKTLGLNNWKIFYKIAIPLAWPGIIGGLVLSFARALGEFGATLMIAGNIPGKTQTMPLAIFFEVQAMDYKGAMLWVITIVAISVVMIFILNKWSDKQQEIVGKRG
ncbi:molybdate ABC transporter permease subunit [Terrisporobacter mayombei]|uniref:Molybdenum transport system permease n=1 Tax=Terrisporobacter mayombei TaxID=1541 RepID=A0ABY9Q2T8_9FIRM|nr:molybdate ABC transporter permease subunit [Terrisporobacter mayombei]MCC3867450.1 molybdate ABC transporter permease subunit [Terrisporobacter mayombei]WMT81709.1 Molybdenum transport system permease protein ModB [Terrisporobacter mayombei]